MKLLQTIQEEANLRGYSFHQSKKNYCLEKGGKVEQFNNLASALEWMKAQDDPDSYLPENVEKLISKYFAITAINRNDTRIDAIARHELVEVSLFSVSSSYIKTCRVIVRLCHPAGTTNLLTWESSPEVCVKKAWAFLTQINQNIATVLSIPIK